MEKLWPPAWMCGWSIEAGQTIFAEQDVKTKGEHRLALGPIPALRPDNLLALEVTARKDGDTDAQSQVREHLELAAPVYVTHLMTDKPMYLPGETVHFRSLTLDRFSLKPPVNDFSLVYSITKPTQEKIDVAVGASRLIREPGPARELSGPDGKPLNGVGGGEFVLKPDDPGGEYTLTVSELNNRFPPQERKFVVNQYQPGQLNKELNFSRSSYGPGETVGATCRAARADGTPVAKRAVQADVFIDGLKYGADGKPAPGPIPFTTDAKGEAIVSFKLPPQLSRGEGTLAVTFDDGGNTETIVRTIPIVLKKLQIEFFPEGGELVAGVPNRVYFQVRTTLDKPADLQGRLVDQKGKVVGDVVRTLSDAALPGVNQGMGSFAFTPQLGQSYELKIETPSGIEGRFPLPPVREDGIVLNVPDGVTGPTDAPARPGPQRQGKSEPARHRLLPGIPARRAGPDGPKRGGRRGDTAAVSGRRRSVSHHRLRGGGGAWYRSKTAGAGCGAVGLSRAGRAPAAGDPTGAFAVSSGRTGDGGAVGPR